MESFRFFLSIPYLNKLAIANSNIVLGLGPKKKSVVRRMYRRYRVLPPVPKVSRVKLYHPPVFSIDLDNMFEVLDI